MAKAEECMTEGRYQDALGFYQNALTLMPADVNARLAMADIYKADGEYDAALVFYMDVLSVDSNNIEAYSNLIDIYDKREDYKSIKSLMANATSAAALALFDDYVVEAPTLSPSVGVYDDYIEIVPFSVEGYDVYYTMDGSDPTAGKGILYDDTTQIDLDENGTYEIAVACKNQKGIFSDVATGTYVIDVKPPEYAIVSPDGGHVDADTLITITAENGCSIYYTWDDTDPTDASERYAEPIAVPEGNNVLSVIAVNDSTGMSSGIYRTNFVVE
jgi:tetratricopeptide (TPR) repeat protein